MPETVSPPLVSDLPAPGGMPFNLRVPSVDHGVLDDLAVDAIRWAVGLRLTPEGKRSLEGITQAVKAHDARMSAALSAKETAELQRFLGKLMGPTEPVSTEPNP